MRRVAITGIGLINAIGVGRAEVWRAMLNGISGVRPIAEYDATSFRSRLGGEIAGFDPEMFASRRKLRLTTRNDQLAIAGAALAVADAGIDFGSMPADRAGLFLGGNKEISKPEHLLEGSLAGRRSDGRADLRRIGEHASSAFFPLFYVEGLQSASMFHVSQAYGLMGANAYFHGTSDAGAMAIGRGFRAIRNGECDVAIAGGFDDATSWWSMSKMDAIRALSTANELGDRAFRPYDRRRSGSVLGEGAALLVLEELASARRRGAHVYAEITGLGATLDCDHLLTPEPSGRPLATAVRRSLRGAGVHPADVGVVVTHGCATRLGDVSETRALRDVFGSGSATVGTSVKPSTGHLLAGAGALNAAVCALTLDEGLVPPTLNLDDVDPDCRWNWVTETTHRVDPLHGVVIARGLEGQQVALTLSATDEVRA